MRGFAVPADVHPDIIALLFKTPQDEARGDGRLVVAPEADRLEARILWPVRLTRAAWDQHVAVTPSAAQMLCDERGRLWDLLTMFKLAAARSSKAVVPFEFLGVVHEPRVQKFRLYAFIAPDEHERPTIVFATPEEALGEAQGGAIRLALSLFDPFSDEDDEDPDLLGDALA